MRFFIPDSANNILQDLREVLDVPTHQPHLIISPFFPGTWGELPIHRQRRDLQSLGVFPLALNRHICKKTEKGRPVQAL